MRFLAVLAVLTAPTLAQRLPTHVLDDPSPTGTGYFGRLTAASGDRVAVAGLGKALGDLEVVIFHRAPDGWTLEAVVEGSQVQPGGDSFGVGLALDEDRLVVGAIQSGEGVVYSFEFMGGTWVETGILASPGAGTEHESFGKQLDLQGDTLLVGEPASFAHGAYSGAGYVYRAVAGSWALEQELVPSMSGSAFYFGLAVALDGDVCVVGSPLIDSAFVFRRTGTTWAEEAVLTPPGSEDWFGLVLDIEGDRVLVGAPKVNNYEGAAFFYERTAGVWQHDRTLLPEKPEDDPRFGSSVALRGDLAVITAPFAKDGTSSVGRADVYTRAIGSWQPAPIRSFEVVREPGWFHVYLGWFSADIVEETVILGGLGAAGGEGKVFTFALDDPLGTSYCSATANSTGAAAAITARGSSWRSDETVTFAADDLPAGQLGYLLASESTTFVPFFGGSQGNLCVGAPQFRFAKDVLIANGAGRAEHELDFDALPAGMDIAPGSTWHYQLWYRDVNPGPTSNTTDGLQLLMN